MIEVVIWTCLLLQMLYAFWIRGFSKVWDEKVIGFFVDENKKDLPSVSFLIPFRNEEENLKLLLDDIAAFDYPKELLQIIFVNDHSNDKSVEVINNSKLNFDFLVINSDGEGKKAALSKGITNAKNTWIVTTDADTRWTNSALKKLLSHPRINDVEMICGVVLLNRVSNNILEILQEHEFAILQSAGVASLFKFEPLLNSGANLAFRKYSFNEVNGYENYMHIASGDDTFLMLEFAKRWSDSVVSNPGSMVSTSTVSNWSDYFQQRIRWGKKVSAYKDKSIKKSGLLFLLSNVGITVLMVLATFNLLGLFAGLVGLLFRFTSEYALLNRFYSYYKKELKVHEVFLVSVLYPIVFICTLILGFITPNSWKGRKL